MKKNWLCLPCNREIIKLLLKMKITVFFILIAVLGSLAAESYSQSTKLTLNIENSSVKKILSEIEDQSEFRFFYSGNVDVERKTSILTKDCKIFEILDKLFENTDVKYEVRGRQIALLQESETFGFPKSESSQPKTIKGNVIDESGEPLPGVTVVVEGTTKGTITDIDGNYTLTGVIGDDILAFSFVGMTTQKVEVGNKTTINITLKTDAIGVEEVVVTALGIKREKKALGYSTQMVGSGDLEKAESPDLASKLSGKVAGLQINTAATIGGSSRIVLRGESSLSIGGNQALIVVDGVPVNTQGSYAGGIDWGNGFSDFNSNDIESVSVLKGAAAAALYGSNAANGVLLITTKKGNKDRPFTIEYNSSLMFESLLTYPNTYQYEYAVGEGDTRWLYDPVTGHYNPAPRDETWSSEKYDHNKLVEWWFSPTENGFRAGDSGILNKGEAQKLPFVSSGKNNYEEFFEVGRTLYNQIAISSSGKGITSRFSLGDMNQIGMQPGTDLKRRSIAASFNTELSKKMRLDFSFNYVKTTSDNRPRQHWGPFSINYVLSWMMPGVYMDQLKNYWQPGLEGTNQINWRTGHNNPYFLAHEVKASLAKDRFFGNVALNYDITNQLSVMLRHGDDYSMSTTTDMYPFGAVVELPRLTRSKSETRVSNTDILLTYHRNFDDIWSLEVSAGANRSNSTGESLTGSSSELLVPGLYNLGNSAVATSVGEGFWNSREYSLLSLANISYRNMVYLALTARNSWSSTLPVENNSYFYPSASLSVLMNQILALSDQISLLKIRGGFAQVGKGTGAHNLITTLSRDGQYEGFLGSAVSNNLKNSELKPELSKSWEFGLESSFYENRLGLDFTYYTTSTINQIIPIKLPQSSGYDYRVTNAGEIKNSGIECTLHGKPVKRSNLDWDVTVNFSANRNKVIELAEGMEQYELAGYGDSGEKIIAHVGKPIFGVFGYKQVTVEDPTSSYYGQKVFSPGGTPIRKNDPEYLGQANPDFIVGLTNKVNYKNLSFSFVLDMRKGGITYSNATNIMYGGGFNKETAEWRNNGYLGEGVIVNADGTYRPNDVVIQGDDVKAKLITNWRDISTNNIFSSSFIKVRELSLAYNIPKNLTKKVLINKASIALVGRNLFVWDKVPNQDADVFHSGIPGYTGGYTYPTARNYGLTLNVSF
uniref:SusC/RagA family TonB-linked outer membrane protein n=1 Tax=uncultured Draconibacterium sp. TaxID=1573823 RepID=UPI003216C68A